MKNIFSLLGWLVLGLLPLLARAGTPVLTLQATVPASAVDVTAFVDRVEILSVATGAVVASAVPNAGFETTGSLGAGSFGYNPTGAGWAFNAQSGLATNGSGFNNPTAPEGTHVAFLQTTSGGAGSLSQTLPGLPAGLYQVRVQLAQRGSAPANQGVRLLIDGSVVGTYTPANDGGFHGYTSPVFLVDAVLRFEGTGSPSVAGADVTAFLDQVEIINAATGLVVAGTVPNAGFETTGSLGAGSYGYNPTGAGWAFNATSGLATNGSGFNNATAPEGTHVALLQYGTSSIEQTLRGLAAGIYEVRVQASQRNTSPANQGVRMFFNGELLRTFTPSVNSFQAYQSTLLTIAEPVITSFTPTSGPEGTLVTITGTGLIGATSVSFNGTPQTNFWANTGTSLTLPVPAGATTGPLAVTTPNGTSSPSAPFSVCRLTANGQNAALTLAADGTGSIAASAFDNGSSTTCGPLTVSVRKADGAVYGSVAEGGTLTLTAPAGTTFTSVDFASYGTPTGTNGSYTQGSCNSGNSRSVVETALLGQTGAVSIVANNASFGGDPCGGTAKTLAVRASYSFSPAATLAYTCADLGPQSVLLTLSDAGGNTSTQSLTVTVVGAPTATIASLSPQPAVPGTTVTATGTNLSGAIGLTVNGVITAINSLTATGFTFVVPGGVAGAGSVVLTLPCAQSVTQPFDTGLPSITGFTPASGLVNSSVTITGTNLANATGLTLNGVAVPVANITTNTATLLTFTLPAGATTGRLVVTTASAASAPSSASFSVLPGIVSFTPTNGGVGTSITITGTTLAGVTGLTLNGVAVPVGNITANTATSLTFTVPAGGRTGQLTVTTPSGTSPLSSQTFYIAPVISSLSPSYGPVGTSLALAGVNLAGATALTLNGAAVPVGNITSNTATALAFTVPAGATTGPVTVTNPAGTSPASSQTFTVTTGTPGSLTFSPASGAVGTLVTLTGTALAGATSVTVNGFAGNILSNSATSLAFTVGTGATTGRIVVRTSTGTAVSATNFVVGIPQPACFEVADTVSTAANGGYTALVRCDDCYQQIDLGFSFRINGQVYTSCYINNNGTVSFGAGVPAWNPGVFPSSTVPIIAPFFGDVDTRAANSGQVWYKLYPDRLVVLWNRVGYYSIRVDKKNTFEVIIRRNTVAPVPAADITLAYGDMRWTTGDASSAAGAVAGFDAADGTHYYNVGSFTAPNISTLSGSCINLSMNTSPQPAGNYWQPSVFPPVKLLVFSPSPAGVGQDVVATGQGLAGATRLVVNGADATASLANSASGGFTFRVPAVASLTGVTTLTATNTVPANIAFSLLPAPGNALALDGANDYVSVPHAAAFNLTTALTLEAWVRTSVTTEQYIITKGEDSWYLGLNGAGAAPGRASFFLNGPSAAGGWLYGTRVISDGHWHHVAGTYDGATLSLYVDGVLEGSRAASGAVATGTAPLLLGSRPTRPTWNGSLDEVRIWRTARTAADIVAGLYQVPALPQTDLAAYFNFDRGTPAGQNQNYDTFREVLSGLPASLTNVALTGAASNWVESYALVVPPTPTTAAVTPTSFTVSWQRPALGSITGFGVDVSTSATFATATSFTLAPTATSQAVPGLTAGTRYYFRVRADRTAITGQGAYATGSILLPTAACGVAVASFTPSSGNLGSTVVTITGSGLRAGTVTAITFGGVSTTAFTVVNATTITVTVPAGALSGPIGLVTACGTFTTAQPFTVAPPTLTQLSPGFELPGQSITITGTNFVPGSGVSFGTQPAAGITYNSPVSLTAMVPVGAGREVVVNTQNGTSVAANFTLLKVADAAAVNACTTVPPASNPVDSNWHYLLINGNEVVAAYNTGGRNAGTLRVEYLRADPAQPVRQDSRSRYYLGRNWHLTNTLGPFPGNSVKVRFYGLSSEYTLLQAADPAHVATLADLRLSQYSGPNEDCALANNNNVTGTSVLLTPTTTYGPDGSNFFVAEAVVPNHFSEFYLGGNSTPLPVELTAFTATLAGNAAVRLAWATASEKNSARFEVERSLDGARFGVVGTVPAAGSSSAPRSYGLVDPLTLLPAYPPTLYYRLRQVDLDGTASYSPVRSVTLEAKAGLALYPNPATGAATLSGTAPGTLVRVFDALGRQVLSATTDAAGTAALRLPHGLASGVYVVRAGATALRLVVE